MRIRRIWAMILRYFYVIRDPSRIFEFIFWPMIDIGWLGLVALWAQSEATTDNFVRILVVAIVLWQIIYRAHYEICFNILDDVIDHYIPNLVTSPLKKREWIAAMMMSGLFKSIFTLCFGALIAYFFFSVNVFILGNILLIFFILSVFSGWIIGFLGGGVILLKGAKLQQIPWILIMLVSIVSAAYFPLEFLPSFLRVIARMLPMSYLFEGIRMYLQEGRMSVSYLLISFGLSIFYLALSISFFLYLFEKSRKKGLDRLA